MKKKPTLYFNQNTGAVAALTKKQAQNLPDHIKKIEFIKNAEGKDTMRFNFDGAVVDVLENDTEVEIEPIEPEGA